MPLDEIKALPVARIAQDDCALLIWVPSPLLPEGLEVINAWGFTFKTVAFNWLKMTPVGKVAKNLGNYTMGSTELCLLATRGRPKPLRRDIEQFVCARRYQHSQKPAEVRRRIEKLFDGPRIELFARQKMEGWDSWGKEVNGGEDIIRRPKMPTLFDV